MWQELLRAGAALRAWTADSQRQSAAGTGLNDYRLKPIRMGCD
jgi:hypothetical protein